MARFAVKYRGFSSASVHCGPQSHCSLTVDEMDQIPRKLNDAIDDGSDEGDDPEDNFLNDVERPFDEGEDGVDEAGDDGAYAVEQVLEGTHFAVLFRVI